MLAGTEELTPLSLGFHLWTDVTCQPLNLPHSPALAAGLGQAGSLEALLPCGSVGVSDPAVLSPLQIEMAILRFPYESWGTPFQQLKQVVEEPSPQLPADRFSPEFVDFTAQW